MIPKRHWTPRYLWDRSRLAVWQRLHPDAPWLPPAMVGFLDGWLRRGDRVVEFGSGRSTAWLARRVTEVTSVEHDREWLRRVEADLRAGGLDNVALIETSVGDPDSYLAPLIDRWSGTAELILVDGRHRERAALWALEHVAPGGVLAIDNAERYLRSDATGPEATGVDAPEWAEVARRIEGSRTAWFDSGVTATLVIWV